MKAVPAGQLVPRLCGMPGAALALPEEILWYMAVLLGLYQVLVP